MSSSAVDQASLIGCPIAAAAPTTRRGVYRIATSTMASNSALPSVLRGCFLRLKARGSACQVAFTEGAGVTLTLNQASALGTGHAQAGYTIEVGEFIDVLTPRTATHLHYVAEGAGFLEIFVSELPGV